MNERLRAHMDELEHTRVDGAGVDVVMAAGRRHQRRRAAGMTVAGAAVVVVMAFGANAFQSAIAGDETDRGVADGDRTGEEHTSEETVGDAEIDGELEWATTESPLGYAPEMVDAGDTLYALTTAPGTRGMQPNEAPQAIFATGEGTDWSHQVLDDDLYVADIDEGRGVLYAVGTAPGMSVAEGTSPPFQVGVTEDGGASWIYTDLPSQAQPPVGMPVDHTWASAGIAAGDDAVVVATATRYGGDLSGLAPEEYRGDGFQTVAGDEGIRVIDWDLVADAEQECLEITEDSLDEVRVSQSGRAPVTTGAVSPDDVATTVAEDPGRLGEQECFVAVQDPAEVDEFVVHTATWDELGIEGGPIEHYEMFVSADGDGFERVEWPFPDTGSAYELPGVVAVDGGFLAHHNNTASQRSRLWFSPDGRSWEQASELPEIQGIVDTGMIDGRLVVIGNSGGTAVVASAPDIDGAWTVHDVPIPPAPESIEGIEGATPMVGAGDVGPAGVAVLVMSREVLEEQAGVGVAWRTERQLIVTSADLQDWAATPVDEIVGGPGIGYLESVTVTDRGVNAGITVTDPDGGRPTHLWSVGLPAGAD